MVPHLFEAEPWQEIAFAWSAILLQCFFVNYSTITEVQPSQISLLCYKICGRIHEIISLKVIIVALDW